MNVDLTVLVGLVCTILGATITVYKTKKDNDKSIREDTVQDTVLATKLDYISKGVDDIRIDFKTQAREIQNIKLAQARLEESLKVAHHRIEDLEKKEGV